MPRDREHPRQLFTTQPPGAWQFWIILKARLYATSPAPEQEPKICPWPVPEGGNYTKSLPMFANQTKHPRALLPYSYHPAGRYLPDRMARNLLDRGTAGSDLPGACQVRHQAFISLIPYSTSFKTPGHPQPRKRQSTGAGRNCPITRVILPRGLLTSHRHKGNIPEHSRLDIPYRAAPRNRWGSIFGLYSSALNPGRHQRHALEPHGA